MSNKKAKREAAREAREAREGRKAMNYVAGGLVIILLAGLALCWYMMA